MQNALPHMYLTVLASSAFPCLMPLLHHQVIGCVLGDVDPLAWVSRGLGAITKELPVEYV